MWIEASGALPSDIDKSITEAIGERVDRQDTVWLDLSSGGRVVLAANGGWRTAAESAFHALYISPAGEVTDVTTGLLGGRVPFDSTQSGDGTYSARLHACNAHIEKALGVTPRRVNYGQIRPVQTI